MSLGQGMNVLWFGAKGDGVSVDSDVVNGSCSSSRTIPYLLGFFDFQKSA